MSIDELDKLNRADRELILSIVPPETHVLDLGCGDGGLLTELVSKKSVVGRGLDIDEKNLIEGICRGLSVYQGNLDDGLGDYTDQSYDYVILNQTLQVITRPETVLREMLRVGKHAIVGFPNFGHWRLRNGLCISGRMPKSKSMPFEWYNTPNIHPLTILDFREYCRLQGISIIDSYYLMFGSWRRGGIFRPLANLFAVTGMFVITKTNSF